MIINPRGMGVIDWTDRFALQMDRESPVMRLDDPDDWREWVLNLRDPSVLGQNVPNPYHYDDWEEWAIRLYNTVELI